MTVLSTEASPAELKALANPLRMRIIRLCLHESLTNKQLADRLGKDPATTLHHVRNLLDNGFLEAEPPRNGENGALEKPYRSTNKSWSLTIPHSDMVTAVVATIDATRQELVQAGADSMITSARMGLQLSAAEIENFADTIRALVSEYAGRKPTPEGKRVGFTVILHHLDPPATHERGTEGP
jgi:predicted ArsR family transcriptional regulator